MSGAGDAGVAGDKDSQGVQAAQSAAKPLVSSPPPQRAPRGGALESPLTHRHAFTFVNRGHEGARARDGVPAPTERAPVRAETVKKS